MEQPRSSKEVPGKMPLFSILRKRECLGENKQMTRLQARIGYSNTMQPR